MTGADSGTSPGGARRVFSRYSIASLLATAISQVVLLWLYWAGGTDAVTASTVAFLAGAVPHFLMVRRWAWGTTGRAGRGAQVLAYTVVTAAGGLLSVGITTLVDLLIDPLVTDRGWRSVLLNAAYVLGGLPVFLLKFFALDRVFRHHRDDDAPPPVPSSAGQRV